MSLRALKETLKPCTNSSSSSFASIKARTETSTSHNSDSTAKIPRKPPKSSLSQQLLRLQDPLSLPSIEPPKPRESNGGVRQDDNGEEEKQGEAEEFAFVIERPHKVSQFQFDQTGPYEPLVLSSQGEIHVVQVPSSINCRLLEHQREGVKFLYGLYKNNHGGILGDDMGLGKTIQTIAFLAAVYDKDGDFVDSTTLKNNQLGKKGPVLIICPSSVIHNWESEFSKWASFSVSIYHGTNRGLIYDRLEAHLVEVLITSFDTYRIQGNILSGVEWEIVIVDEVHRLKNERSKLYVACLEIKTLKRFGLTGTIMQNKIMELFNLFDCIAPGSLGTREHFREFYDEPLKHGQRSTAPQRFVHVANERKQHLAVVLRKYMLRRTKEETIGHLMMGKEDNVVFCAMSELQKRAYRRMLQLPDVRALINKDLPCSCGSPLTQSDCCKRIVPNGLIWPYLHRDSPDGCDSCPFCIVLPCLVKLQQISNHLELIKPNPKDDPDKQKRDAEFALAVFGSDVDLVGGYTQNESFMGLSDVKHCGKMRALEKLLFSWISQGDKVLLFSYSVRMLNILEKFLIRKGCSFSRLDGSTPTNLRQSLVDDFNISPSKQVFLISTRAGGLGLNLVSANRVVIFDPNWNPAQDLQAQDRSFRFGQKRHVVVFRLIAAGSLEELVYSRQVYKQQLANIAVSGKMENRYFEGVQDCKEFQGELFGICNLFRDLSDKLFTSEIVELNEKQGQQDKDPPSRKQELTELGNSSAPPEEANPVPSPESENDSKKTSSNPTLEDLGIVYAHRNEDIVNFGPGTQGKLEEAVPLNDGPKHSMPVVRRKKPEDRDGKENVSSTSFSMGRKRIQYSLLAQSVGMGEVDFSKWLLSATPSEREKVLRDYNRRRRYPTNDGFLEHYL
ncbi:Putative DNA repair and recombination protein RAD26-like protein [Morus notabilis]|uniref:Putative DNA repair and recombination protein RAD26-like protein n=1 Tax=Morus notabilis TaxID=981085 RepID=W9QNE6_9ROSA|nr:switch 2 [Morus notabilis]EXB44640.1 Putative DNA repair and recombination protein RAD26-like protein [Morus notabilis]